MNQKIELYENDSTISDIGNLILSLRNVYSSWVEVCVGRPGLPNVEKKMNVGDAILFETSDQGIFEVRLFNILHDKNANFLVTHVSPSPGLTAGYIDSDFDNVSFTHEEKKKLSSCLNDLKEKFSESKAFTDEQNGLISRKLDEMIEASDRMGKKDWINWAIGTLTSIAVSASLSTEAQKILFTSIGASLSWLYNSALQLLN